MKKFTLIALTILAFCGISFGLTRTDVMDIDMADYGTSVIITNNTIRANGYVMADVLITYDGASSNTIYFDVTKDGIVYRIGYDTVVSSTYSDARDLISVPVLQGETWTITTTETNVNLHVVMTYVE